MTDVKFIPPKNAVEVFARKELIAGYTLHSRPKMWVGSWLFL